MNFSKISMNWIDYFIASFIFLSICISTIRGFIKEFLSFIFWGCSCFIIINYYDNFSKLLLFINNDLFRKVISITIILSFTIIISTILNNLFTTLIIKLNLSISDKILGAFFGILRGILIISIILIFIEKFTKFSENIEWKRSQLIPQFFNIIAYCFHWLKSTYDFSFSWSRFLL